MENIQLIKYACNLATNSVNNGTGPFGCVITDSQNNIIGEGNNMVTLNNDPTAHAEIVAIRDACYKLNNFNLENCILYTSCEPCPMCLSAIYWSRIKKVYYGNTRYDAKNIGFDDEFIYNEINKPNTEKHVKLIKIDTEENAVAFNKWLEKSDKTRY
jgi:pyrimidine deaminase RibD-like protein